MRTRMAVALSLLAASGCGNDRETLPPACGEGAGEVQAALERAPGPVTMDGTRLSECLTPDADGADLQNVGTAFLETAVELTPRARRDPNGRAALELGYLVGAARRGGDAAAGFHTELLRRLEQEVAPVRRAPAFRRGEAAGRRSG